MSMTKSPLMGLAAIAGTAAAAMVLKRVLGAVIKGATGLQGFRGQIVHFLEDPRSATDIEKAYEYIEDGIIVTKAGKVVCCGPAKEVLSKYRLLSVTDNSKYIMMPGFVDCHIHFPQVDMIGAYGEQLLEWLQKYTFPTEEKFKDKSYADKVAEVFLQEMLRSGTTSALVFCTVHKGSTDALFEAAQRRNMLIIAGKVMMDRAPFAPPGLFQEAKECHADCKYLIDKWHGKGRCLYAVTPRFAITATSEQLKLCGELMEEYKDKGIYMHTHLNENKDEIDLAKELHDKDSYLDIYAHAGLLGPKSVFAHCVHMNDLDYSAMVKSRSVAAFCPTSNLFLGSGFFDIKTAWERKLRFGLGTDVGAGTSFCHLQTLNEAYKVSQMQGVKLDALNSFYIATLGSAAALSLDHRIGNFKVGKEADFVCLDACSTPLMQHRTDKERCKDLLDKLFVLMTIGDDRAVAATYVAGKCVASTDRYKKRFSWF